MDKKMVLNYYWQMSMKHLTVTCPSENKYKHTGTNVISNEISLMIM